MPVFVCKVCGNESDTKTKLRRHWRDHHGPRIKCKFCSYSLAASRNYAMERHEETCRGNQRERMEERENRCTERKNSVKNVKRSPLANWNQQIIHSHRTPIRHPKHYTHTPHSIRSSSSSANRQHRRLSPPTKKPQKTNTASNLKLFPEIELDSLDWSSDSDTSDVAQLKSIGKKLEDDILRQAAESSGIVSSAQENVIPVVAVETESETPTETVEPIIKLQQVPL